MRAFLLLIAFGATAGTLLDALHTFSGTTEYTSPFVLRTAWWVPLLFASAYGVGGFLYAVAHRKLRGPDSLRTGRELAVGLVIFAALYAASAYLPTSNVIKMVVLGVGAVALWLWLDRSLQGLGLALVAAIAGPVTEITLIRLGLFRHRQPDFLGIPMWLPALYLASGPSFGQLSRLVIQGSEPALAAVTGSSGGRRTP